MKKGTIFFHPIEGAGSLTISWTSGPKGDAVEAKKGAGVGFFSHAGELLCVIFDEIQASQDHQTLEFNRYRVEIVVKNSKITHSVTEIERKPSTRKKRIKRKQPINSHFS